MFRPYACAIIIALALAGGHAVAQTGAGSARVVGADGATAAKVGSTGTAAGAGLEVLSGQYKAVLPTLSDGQVTLLQTDSSGRLLVSGGGGGGGDPSSVGTTGAAVPGAADLAGFSDGTNLRGARVFDLDTSGSTQYVLGTNLRISSGGGSIEAVGQQAMASSIPVVIASDQTAIPFTAAALPLPVGAATSSLQTTGNTSLASIDGKVVLPGALDGSGYLKTHEQGTANVSVQNPTLAVTESGTWSVRAQDGSGNGLASSTTTPGGTEQALVVRNIPSGTQTISGAVTVASGTISLPSNAAQETGGNLASIATSTSNTATSVSTIATNTALATTHDSDVQAVTGSAAALPSHASKKVCVTHKPGGTQSYVYVGGSGVTAGASGKGTTLYQGQGVCLGVPNTNLVYVISDGAGSYVNFEWLN